MVRPASVSGTRIGSQGRARPGRPHDNRLTVVELGVRAPSRVAHVLLAQDKVVDKGAPIAVLPPTSATIQRAASVIVTLSHPIMTLA